MPLYWFHVDTTEQPQIVAERIRPLVGKDPGWWEYLWRSWWRVGPPFIGSLGDNSFRLRRDIHYRNSFLPVIRGHIFPAGTGTRINVTMHLHPVVGFFMLFFLVAISHRAAWGFCACGFALMAGGFFPEALIAQRLLTNALLKTETKVPGPQKCSNA
jgi:hypothetical protein